MPRTGSQVFSVHTQILKENNRFVFTDEHPPVNVVAETEQAAIIAATLDAPEALQTLLATGAARLGTRLETGSIVFR